MTATDTSPAVQGVRAKEVEAAAIAAREADGCGCTLNGEVVFCDHPDLPKDVWSAKCACRVMSHAALEAAAQVRAGHDGKVERLRVERDQAQAAAEDYDRDCIDMRYQRDAAEARATAAEEANERLRSVLRPFAELGQHFEAAHKKWCEDAGATYEPQEDDDVGGVMTLGDLRRAAAALADPAIDTAGAGAKGDQIERLESALRDINRWSQAYPLEVFPEADDAYLAKAHAILQQHGMGVDRISASAMRHAVEGVGEIARRALASAEGGRT